MTCRNFEIHSFHFFSQRVCKSCAVQTANTHLIGVLQGNFDASGHYSRRGGSKAKLLHCLIRFLPQTEMKFTFIAVRLPKKTLRQTFIDSRRYLFDMFAISA